VPGREVRLVLVKRDSITRWISDSDATSSN
jgi:hypothetical protein